MSMYGVNAGVPKTLIRYLVSYVAGEMATDTLLDIIDTPISPELIPADEKGHKMDVGDYIKDLKKSGYDFRPYFKSGRKI